MKATVRLFSRPAELAGTHETEIELGEGLTVEGAHKLLMERFPKLAEYEKSFLYAVNGAYVTADRALKDGDELALISPVSGGAGAV